MAKKHITIDDTTFTNSMRQLHKEIGGDAKDIIKTWSRVLLRGVAKDTPFKNKKEAKNSIYKYFHRAVGVLDQNDFNSESIQKMIRRRDYNSFEALVDARRLPTIKEVHPFSPALVDKYLDKRGHRKSQSGVVTLDKRAHTQELNRRIKRAGAMKKWYGNSLRALGENVSSWYMKSANEVPSSPYRNGLNQPSPYFEFWNEAKGIGAMKFFFNKNVGKVFHGMRKSARAILNHRIKQNKLA